MNKRQQNLLYALKDGEITSIEMVESGLACGCICPACREPLIAKKGSVMMHHFAHRSGRNCEYGYETSLHLMAKEILSESKKLTIPPVFLHSATCSVDRNDMVAQAKEIQLSHVELEKRYGNVVPDIVAYCGDKYFFIEIFVTHRIDDEKLRKLQAEDVSTIEIDLSHADRTITKSELANVLLEENSKKIWKYNALANKYVNQFRSVADKRKIISRGFALHIDNCPIAARSWRGKPYANFIDDCSGCIYLISSEDNDFILCSGKSGIASIDDFHKPANVLIMKRDTEVSRVKDESLLNGICPNCGGTLVQRESAYGLFWGCSNYPHCRFTASIDKDTGEIITKS